LNEFEEEIQAIRLIPSDGGRFEVVVNQKLIYSKMRTGKHAAAGELTGLVREILKEGNK
jgi:selenoprotein W-related protein